MKWLALPLTLVAIVYAAIGTIGRVRHADGEDASAAVDLSLRCTLTGIGLLAAFGAGLVL